MCTIALSLRFIATRVAHTDTELVPPLLLSLTNNCNQWISSFHCILQDEQPCVRLNTRVGWCFWTVGRSWGLGANAGVLAMQMCPRAKLCFEHRVGRLMCMGLPSSRLWRCIFPPLHLVWTYCRCLPVLPIIPEMLNSSYSVTPFQLLEYQKDSWGW